MSCSYFTKLAMCSCMLFTAAWMFFCFFLCFFTSALTSSIICLITLRMLMLDADPANVTRSYIQVAAYQAVTKPQCMLKSQSYVYSLYTLLQVCYLYLISI